MTSDAAWDKAGRPLPRLATPFNQCPVGQVWSREGGVVNAVG